MQEDGTKAVAGVTCRSLQFMMQSISRATSYVQVGFLLLAYEILVKLKICTLYYVYCTQYILYTTSKTDWWLVPHSSYIHMYVFMNLVVMTHETQSNYLKLYRSTLIHAFEMVLFV